MKKYLLMTTCLLAGLYALPAHALLAPTPNVWDFYGADADGNPVPSDPTAALDGDPTNLETDGNPATLGTADTNLATKTFLDQPGGYGVKVTAFYKPILTFNPDTNSGTGVSAGAGFYTLGSSYITNSLDNSLLQHNRGLDPQPNGDGVGLGIQTPTTTPPTPVGFVQSVQNIQSDAQEYFDEINFNELIQIDLGVDFAKYKDWKIQLSSMNDSVFDLCDGDFCFQPYNSAEIYTSAIGDPNAPGVFAPANLLTTITTDFVTSLGSNLQRYLYVNPKALPHTDCFMLTISDAQVQPSQCTWDTAFLVRSLSATPIPTDTPEPGILGLLGFALAGLAYVKNRKQA